MLSPLLSIIGITSYQDQKKFLRKNSGLKFVKRKNSFSSSKYFIFIIVSILYSMNFTVNNLLLPSFAIPDVFGPLVEIILNCPNNGTTLDLLSVYDSIHLQFSSI